MNGYLMRRNSWGTGTRSIFPLQQGWERFIPQINIGYSCLNVIATTCVFKTIISIRSSCQGNAHHGTLLHSTACCEPKQYALPGIEMWLLMFDNGVRILFVLQDRLLTRSHCCHIHVCMVCVFPYWVGWEEMFCFPSLQKYHCYFKDFERQISMT